MRKTLLLSLLVLGLFVAPSYAVVVNLGLVTPSSSANQIDIDAWVQYDAGWLGTHSDSDTATSNATGNIIASLDYDFNPSNTSVATLKTIDFTGGTFNLSDVSLDFNLSIITASADSHNLGGTFNTISPPASVTSGPNAQTKYFNTADHEAIVNQGTMTFDVPIVSIDDMDFSQDPLSGTTEGQGSIVTTLYSSSGNNYTYKVRLEMPMEVNEAGSEGDADYDITVAGTLVAEGYFTQTILPPNTAPVANNDFYTVHVSDVLSVTAPGVLGNDSDANGDSLTAIKVSNPTDGDLTFNSNGSFTYDPDTYFRGTDTFTYKANDGTDNSSPATVTIEVYNNAPTVVDDAYTLDQDGFMSVTGALGVLKNDTDIDGDNFSAFVQDNVDNGMLSMNMDGSFVYMPLAGFSGTDTFTYYATDGWDSSDLATVTFTVNAVNPDIPGDANRDGKVDGSDVTILAGNWQHGVTGTANATWEMGDFNADGKVDGSDVTILAGNWQAGVEAATAAVPEPGTLALLLMAAFSLVLIRRKR